VSRPKLGRIRLGYPRSGRRVLVLVTLYTIATVVADQLTKALATRVTLGGSTGAIAPRPNNEFSLGLARASLSVTVVIATLGLATFGGYAAWAAVSGRLRPWVPGLLIGGALSNLIDRVTGGAVRDFLATPWIVFNLADIAVVAGILGFVAVYWRPRQPESTSMRS